MLLLNRSLCSRDLRKNGIINCGTLLFAQILCLVAALWEVVTTFGDTDITSMLVVAAGLFNVIDIIVYSLAIMGLIKKKPDLITPWLWFTPLELIVLQFPMMYVHLAIMFVGPIAICFLIVIGHTLLSTYLYHNMCIVYSARHRLIHNQELQNRNSVPLQNVNVRSANPTSAALLE